MTNTNVISTPEEARQLAQTWLGKHDPAFVAEFITLLAKRYPDSGRSAYARYLLSNAFRELLLPNGYYELSAVSEDYVPGQRTLLDVGGYTEARRMLDIFGEEFPRFYPTESQINDWNIHNDHADGADFDDV